LLPGKLCKKLLKYARKQKITSGEIFLTGGGKPMSRCQIWAEMRRVCKTAGVDSSKVFPHNLRHLFATVYNNIIIEKLHNLKMPRKEARIIIDDTSFFVYSLFPVM